MKWFAILLSVFMMVISCVPGADAAPGEDALAQTTINSNTDSEDHSPAADLCSPLCICNCCTGFVLQKSPQKTNLFVIRAIIPAAVYQIAAISSLSYSIWQPPKVA
ncbi:DUF6660 family protein [Pontibacter ummariensis]|uniref:DUF6660 family protein n=1 Tax=Pontibacter ummariensis TaxID=1610492 RepID=UPI00358E9C67